MDVLKPLKEALESNDLKDYKSIPFWSWNNAIEEDELCRQIEDMKAAGIGGFIMHARTGLSVEYLGEKWFSCVKACLDKAKELDMNAWVYDENGWPSGFVGGKLLETFEYRENYLDLKETDVFDDNAFAVYVKADNGFKRIEKADGSKKFYCVYLMTSPANTDILNPVVVDAFIKETHEKYYERFKEYFGTVLKGFFTDEPQYYRWGTPYTKLADSYFEKDGENIKDGLIYLFINDESGYAFKEKYFTVLNKLYTTNYYKKLYDWCESHGCMLTGHAVEETFLDGQMWGCADVMTSYEYEHIPGMDKLCRNCDNELAPAQIGSVCSQLGKKHILTETYGCSGNDVTPKELKSVGEFQYFRGVNLMCHHLYPYSMAGQGKWDHPPVFSKHSNWFDGFRQFNDYFTKLGYLIVNTDEKYDVGILSPMKSVYPTYVRFDSQFVQIFDEKYNELLIELRKRGITYQILDENLLEKYGSIVDGKIKLGKNEYSSIVIPYMTTISKSTLGLLEGFSGDILSYADFTMIDGVKSEVKIKSNITIDELANKTAIGFRCEDGNSSITRRTSDLGDFIFIKNLSRTESSSIVLDNVAENYVKVDLETMTTDYISNEYTIPASESLILVKSPDAKDVRYVIETTDISDNFSITDVTPNYLVIDKVSISKDGTNFTEYLPVPQQFENLLREDYKGNLIARYKFVSNDDMEAKVVIEKAKFNYVRVNGDSIELETGDFDINFEESVISVKKGENIVEYSMNFFQHDGVHFALFDPLATESLRNCLAYDTSIENIYIKGDFDVSDNLVISKRIKLPKLTSDLKTNGYPFFKGTITISGSYEYDGNGFAEIEILGRFNEAKVFVNGDEKDLVMDFKGDITSMLKKGTNKIEIKVNSSLRNLFGPHHFKPDPEPMGVSPYLFTLLGSWKDGTSSLYTFDYNLVPFGVDMIKVNKKIK